MKEIPLVYVRGNQAGIVMTLLVAIGLQQPWLIAILWLIQIIGLIGGPTYNLFIAAVQPFAAKRAASGKTEAAELQRFNNSLGIVFLTLSLLAFLAGWTLAGYLFAGMMGVAALAALLGYCIGCTIYFQYKQFRAKRLNRV